jgi:hypothetical protein
LFYAFDLFLSSILARQRAIFLAKKKPPNKGMLSIGPKTVAGPPAKQHNTSLVNLLSKDTLWLCS